MAALARAKVGERAEILVRDLHAGLGHVADASQDVVVASLVLHYLKEWEPIFKEFARVLRPHGRIVFSTHHPAWDWRDYSEDDYFAFKQVTEQWQRRGTRDVTFWRRPLRDMTRAIERSGLAIDVLTEPEPLPELAAKDPDADRELRTRPFFLLFQLRHRPADWG
jgi:SAM-dependent methyltransferase